ncbi:SAF domain-containing protein [Rhodococcoides yunnanense]|uniref:SAF domain-containing protein n=1 Tax=Rhodococcoides yunnanense TaxID=278209 RepID=UPI0022B1813B|nr:SAF domain-containing protein [Rhodococcus yunnanensis]MCZ4278542.1 SAF domain-containing protein [Rhodococcus yunnanensis]
MAMFGNLKEKTSTVAVGETRTAKEVSPKPGHDFTEVVSTTKVRRRRSYWIAGVALMAVAIVGAVFLVNAMRATSTILVLARDVPQGETITTDDLKTAEVNSDATIATVPATDKASVVGQSAAVPLLSGSALNPSSVTNAVIPSGDNTLVGITVAIGKLPAEPLLAGDNVRIVDTPRDQDDSPVQGPVTANAQVVAVKEIPETGQTTVDVLVKNGEASWIAARAATNRVAIVLDSRER